MGHVGPAPLRQKNKITVMLNLFFGTLETILCLLSKCRENRVSLCILIVQCINYYVLRASVQTLGASGTVFGLGGCRVVIVLLLLGRWKSLHSAANELILLLGVTKKCLTTFTILPQRCQHLLIKCEFWKHPGNFIKLGMGWYRSFILG